MRDQSNLAGVGLYLHREGPNLGKPCVLISFLESFMSTSSTTSLKSIRTSAVTLPRQLAPTVGPSPSGVIFRAGSLPAGCDGDFAVGQAIVFGNLFFVENAGYRPATAPPATRAIIMPPAERES